MTCVDTSALVAIFADETGGPAFRAITETEEVVIGAPTMLEASMVLSRYDPALVRTFLEGFTGQPNVTIASFGVREWRAASRAFASFGKGRHPARLNYGDCMSYAVARTRGVPILFKGRDFFETDLETHPASVAA